jgi:hypothetical protein
VLLDERRDVRAFGPLSGLASRCARLWGGPEDFSGWSFFGGRSGGVVAAGGVDRGAFREVIDEI